MIVDRQLGPMLKSMVDPMLAAAADKVLLLSCIDLRYPHRIHGYDGYAGASRPLLPARHGGRIARRQAQPGVGSVGPNHIVFGVLQGIKGLIILDHMDCEAYELYEQVPLGAKRSDNGTFRSPPQWLRRSRTCFRRFRARSMFCCCRRSSPPSNPSRLPKDRGRQ